MFLSVSVPAANFIGWVSARFPSHTNIAVAVTVADSGYMNELWYKSSNVWEECTASILRAVLSKKLVF
jgi:hypothetical protein